MRLRLVMGLVVGGYATGLACIPHPTDDYEDFQARIGDFSPVDDGDGGTSFDASQPTEAEEGLYYGACLSQLASGQLDRVFNFYTKTAFVPEEGGGGRLSLSIQPMAHADRAPPETFAESGTVGDPIASGEPSAPNVEASGRWAVDLGTARVPTEANPISERPVRIENTRLTGQFGGDRFCARLHGNVEEPPIGLTLEPEKNICQFYRLEEGAPIPELVRGDFMASSCPE
jgi:hypothetical protein